MAYTDITPQNKALNWASGTGLNQFTAEPQDSSGSGVDVTGFSNFHMVIAPQGKPLDGSFAGAQVVNLQSSASGKAVFSAACALDPGTYIYALQTKATSGDTLQTIMAGSLTLN